MQKIPKNSKIQKNDGHFRIPHPQISLNSFQTFAKIQFIFFTMQTGGKMIKDFRETEKLLKN